MPDDEASKWDLDQLLTYLESDSAGTPDPAAGAELYTSTQCASCHRHGSLGESVGPELTSITRRFTRREILESILYPSHIVSDRYATRRVLTLDGEAYVGMVSTAGDRISIRNSRNEVTELKQSEIDQILPGGSSIMPSGLIEQLSQSQVRDLMAFLSEGSTRLIASRP